jgi:predicted transcriptional regulator
MNSLLTLITSRKTQRVLLGIVTTLTTLYFSWPTLTPEGRRTAVIAAEVAIAGLLSADIVGIAHEDAAKATATGSAAAGGDPPTVAPVAPAPAEPMPPPAADIPLTPAQQQHVATIARQQILAVIQNAQKQKQQAQAVAETLTPAQPVTQPTTGAPA